ncbi:hypothetical protein DdX_09825 [Ditylenchus destructor]|uniref:Uncharacterized protein n=1 Tax=Ditylenchus destructor TaxID=166010 RepID=A0AAD4N2S8_9BILA|nr:hypothetical protein DdX_09825 [Ditylenchus destructor]
MVTPDFCLLFYGSGNEGLIKTSLILFRDLNYSAKLIPTKSMPMSCSKPLPPFVCDSLYYLNRYQLESFAIVSRALKNFIQQYFGSKPYRVFDQLRIRPGSYQLLHNDVRWHPNKGDYSVQQFLSIAFYIFVQR